MHATIYWMKKPFQVVEDVTEVGTIQGPGGSVMFRIEYSNGLDRQWVMVDITETKGITYHPDH